MKVSVISFWNVVLKLLGHHSTGKNPVQVALEDQENKAQEKILFNVLTKKLSFRGVIIKRGSENMQQIYRRTPMPKCDFNKLY